MINSRQPIGTPPNLLAAFAGVLIGVCAGCNEPPTQPTIGLEPESPTGDDAITAIVLAPSTDPDGDVVSYRYAWLRDGVATDLTIDTLPPSDTVKGELWTVRVTPTDGVMDGLAGEASVLIANSIPSIGSVHITPNPAQVTDDLRCAWVGFSDSDDDPNRSTRKWTVNGVNAGSGAQLTSGFRRGDRVACVVTPNDGEIDGPSKRAEITIQNAPPQVTRVAISPEYPLENDVLTCSWTSVDFDGDPDHSTVRWLRNGVVVGTAPTLNGPHTIGSTVTCQVTGHDGYGTGSTMSAEARIWPCGANSASVGDNRCECSGLYSWCSSDTQSPLYGDCCAFFADTFKLTVTQALFAPEKPAGGPWDWDGAVPDWLTEALDTLGPHIPDPQLTAAVAMTSEVLGLIDQYAPALLEGTVPPDPQLWFCFVAPCKSTDHGPIDAPDNIYQVTWNYAVQATFTDTSVLWIEVWDDDVTVDDLMVRVGQDLDSLQVNAGRGEVFFYDHGGALFLGLRVDPVAH